MASDINGLSTPSEDEGRNWVVARKEYYAALTYSEPQFREIVFAETFQTLGYIIHLLQDMAVPAHTRNDFSQGHIRVIGCPDDDKTCFRNSIKWIGNKFEGYVRDHFYDEIYPEICSDDVECKEISIPFKGEKKITNFWDTNTNNPETPDNEIDFTSQNIGLAEYSNINFVSEKTILTEDDPEEWGHKYKYPNKSSIAADPNYPEKPDYFLSKEMARDGKLDDIISIRKNAHGEIINTFLKARYININEDLAVRPRYELQHTLDDACYLEYAKRVIPRAIGYSASLLDYFFRGKLDFTFNGSEVTIFNGSEEIMQNGKFELYSDTKEGGIRSPVLPEPVTVEFLPPGASQTFSINGGIPGDADQLILVYTGELGNEKPVDSEDPRQVGAVIGKVLKLDSRIAYSFQADGAGNPSHIHTTSSDGSEAYQVTGSSTSASASELASENLLEASAESGGMGTPEEPLYFSPSWSRDGSRLAFETLYCTDYNSDMSCSSANVVRDISVIDTHSESPFPDSLIDTLTYDNAWLSYPSFSPDGTRVAVLMQKNNEITTWLWANLLVINLEDGTSTIVNQYDDPLYTSLAGSRPVWSPTGDQIL
ncbi:MAG: hypothetical protein D3908_07645, partial [Candidatus Electrothrix sp. AUS4]|nr:hypothetical protein [Candidatus Electrothrix sp. AUS4]